MNSTRASTMRLTRSTAAQAGDGPPPPAPTPTEPRARQRPETATPPAPPAPPAPLVLDRYRLTRRLGAGAFGTVWMAHDERLDRTVAVKILRRERVNNGRFEREARAAARLAHPGIVTLYEAAVDDEGAYLVSELVRGSTLDDLLAAGHLSDRDIVAIGIALCDALDHAHGQAVVHRDVKPSNVLVPEAPASGAQLAKLTDFGVARVIGGDALTLTGDVLGTLAYMAPEQAEGLPVGPSADLYSLALVLYEALTGVNPLAAVGQRTRRLGAHLPPLRRQRRDLPRALAHGLDQALRPRPAERGSIIDLRRALNASLDLVADDPGIVAAPWATTATRALTRASGSAGDTDGWSPLPDSGAGPPVSRNEPGLAVHSDQVPRPAERPAERSAERSGERPGERSDAGLPVPTGGRPAPRDLWPPRALGAVVAAAMTAWLAAHLLGSTALAPATAGLLAAAAVLVFPRLGWAALTVAMSAGAIIAHRPGGALVVVAAAALPVLLAPTAPTAWPLAAVAAALGLTGLAGAWPALAGRATTAWRRAVLGAMGWVWLALGSALAGRALYLPRPPGSPAPAGWTGSLSETVAHVLGPLVSSGALAGAVVWAAAAVAAPWLTSGRAPVLDVLRVAAWSALTVWAAATAVVAVHGSDQLGPPSTAVVGAIAATVVVLAPSALSAWRQALRPAGASARVP